MAGAVIGKIASSVVPALIGGLLNRGNDKASREAASAQLELSNQLLDIFKQQAALDLPFQRDLQGALRERMGRSIPRFTPSRGPAVNPLARRTRATSLPVTQSLPTGVSRRFAPPPGQGVNEARLGRALQQAFNVPQGQGGFGGSLDEFFSFADRGGADPLGALGAQQAGGQQQQPSFAPSLLALLQGGR
jgi:hypothetical protein